MIKDRQRVVRLRKRLSLLLMVTIAILLWVKNKYNDIEYLQDEMDYQSIVIEEQCKLIDSLSGIFENNIKKDTIIAKIEHSIIKHFMTTKKTPKPTTWLRDDGSIVACTEKIKVMQENFAEIKQMTQDALEDGLLMEVSESQMRAQLHVLIDALVNSYQKNH